MHSDFSKIKDRRKKKPRKPKTPPYTVPKWFVKLQRGSHGGTNDQKKAWKVVSDYVRERDFRLYGKKCVDGCGFTFERWQDGQAGHFKSWGASNGLFKFDLRNIALQYAGCNTSGDGRVGYGFALELKRRYGPDILEWIEKENQSYRGQKIELWELVELVKKLRPDLVIPD